MLSITADGPEANLPPHIVLVGVWEGELLLMGTFKRR